MPLGGVRRPGTTHARRQACKFPFVVFSLSEFMRERNAYDSRMYADARESGKF